LTPLWLCLSFAPLLQTAIVQNAKLLQNERLLQKRKAAAKTKAASSHRTPKRLKPC
jgi:hypothetical protein